MDFLQAQIQLMKKSQQFEQKFVKKADIETQKAQEYLAKQAQIEKERKDKEIIQQQLEIKQAPVQVKQP